MKHKGFLLDLDRCVGCQACVMACRNENQTSACLRWRRVVPVSEGVFQSISCNHCESPECFRVCPQRAYTKRRDGIVIINSDRCDGCRTCVAACPYKAPQYDAEKHRVSKCHFCLPRQLEGRIPACVEACHTGALKVIDLGEELPEGLVLTSEGFPDIRLTRPSVRFRPVASRTRYWQMKNS